MADNKETEIAPGTRVSEASVHDANSSDANGAVHVPAHSGELDVIPAAPLHPEFFVSNH
jgi:hypothetical protein